MSQGMVDLLPSTAAALDALGLGHVGRINTPEPMAWIVLVLRELPDDEKTFPHGKWATIQAIEGQLRECALDAAKEVRT